MLVRKTACLGITVLLCAAAPAYAPAAESAVVPSAPSTRPANFVPALHAAGIPTPYGPPDAILAGATAEAPQATPRASNRPQIATRHRFRHIRHHVRVPPAVPLGEIRTQIAQTVGLINQMDENVRNQITENRADVARLTAAMDGQNGQLSLIDKRVDGMDQRQASETRSRRQDAALLQTHIAEQGARIDGVEQRLVTLAAARASTSLYLAGGLAGLGILLGVVALVVSYRQRLAAIAQAESHADRLFRTYRAEFESLAQAARDLEARLQKGALPPPTPAMHLYPESQPVPARL